jgi:hypothetical protein
MKQTALQWFIEQLINEEGIDFIPTIFVNQANAMFEEQIKDAYGDGLNSHRTEFCNRDEYFVKTYGGKK